MNSVARAREYGQAFTRLLPLVKRTDLTFNQKIEILAIVTTYKAFMVDSFRSKYNLQCAVEKFDEIVAITDTWESAWLKVFERGLEYVGRNSILKASWLITQ